MFIGEIKTSMSSQPCYEGLLQGIKHIYKCKHMHQGLNVVFTQVL